MKNLTIALIAATAILTGCNQDSGLKEAIAQQKIDNAKPINHYVLKEAPTENFDEELISLQDDINSIEPSAKEICFKQLRAGSDHQIKHFNELESELMEKLTKASKSGMPTTGIQMIKYQIRSAQVARKIILDNTKKQTQICNSK